MEQFTVDAAFIKEAHGAACADWKRKLERKFPEVFRAKNKIGDRYVFEDDTYILARTGDGWVTLINLTDGNRWKPGVPVKNDLNITDVEIGDILGHSYGNKFQRVNSSN